MSNALKRILIIDDSAAIQRLVHAHLEDVFPNVSSASDGVTGLALAATLNPDLILLDLDLPDMNGFDVCRFLKANPSTASIPIVFLSASNSIDAKVCGLDLHAADYITKPFDGAELCARVRMALRAGGASKSLTLTSTLPAERHGGDSNDYWEFG